MTRLVLLLLLAASGPALAQKRVAAKPPPPPVPTSTTVMESRYDLATFMKREKQFDTAEKVARALNDTLRLGYDAKKKGDRRLVVVSGKELEVRATASEHALVRMFLEQGGNLTPQQLR